MGSADYRGGRRRHRRASSRIAGHKPALPRTPVLGDPTYPVLPRKDRPAMSAHPDTEIDFEIRPSQARVPAAERERILAAPGFGQVFTDHMITHALVGRARLARRQAGAVRPVRARPGDRGVPLRAGALRGAEGVPPAVRVDRHVPPAGERGALQHRLPAGWRCRSCPRRRSCGPWSCSSPRTRTGSPKARGTASTCARS